MSAWPYAAGGGYIGLRMYWATFTELDDFGGGTRPVGWVPASGRASGKLALMTDHLGSTTSTIDANGAVVAKMLHKPWGEVRYSSGTMPTDRTYTGQISEPDLGLSFYNARWYDSYLNRFLSPDTIVPDLYNPQDWDRYSYVRNNPIRYNDPGGHKACEDTDGCLRTKVRNFIDKKDYQKWLKDYFGWTTSSDFSLKELITIYESGWAKRPYASNQTSGKGKDWMDKYIGDAKFVHNPIKFSPLDSNMGPAWNIVLLNPGWISDSRGPESILIHELGHVVDNQSSAMKVGVWDGTGWGDDLAEFVGGSPSGIRWANGDGGIPIENQWSDGTEWLNYGNNSTADYFAHTFSFAVLNPQDTPTIAHIWLNVRVSYSLP